MLTFKNKNKFSVEFLVPAGTVHLEVEQGATPVVAPPRTSHLAPPTSLKSKLKQELDRLQQLEVIAPIDEPTPWVSSLAVVVKKSGALQICIDPRLLNTSLKKERYQLPVLEDILPELSKARVFTTVDLKSGYWHCVLAPESSVLTTFATPYGKYRWGRLPFGLSASSEIFQKHLNQALKTCLESCALQTTFLSMGVTMPTKKPRQITIEISKTSYSDA